ncbi:MAG: hypothetical protein ABIR54_01040 [Burkholderiaceae bacterium]
MTRLARRSLRRLVVGALLTLLGPACYAALESAPNGPTAGSMPVGITSPIADDAAHALWWGDFDRLEAQYRAVRQSTDLVDGGAPRLQWFRVGLARVFEEDDATDPYYAQLEAMTQAWATAHATSPLAQLLYARALFARGQALRGGAYSRQVPAAAMREFERYLQLALDQLDSHADLLKDESTADVYMMMFGRWQGWKFDRLHALALDTLARNASDGAGFAELATASLPKWGGNPHRVDEVVREATRRIKPAAGMATYAYLYDDFESEFDGELFSASEVDWPTMKRGFRDRMTRFPSQYALNRFALEACLAQDRATTVELLDQIGPKPLQRAWGNRFESCRRWARSP